MSNTIQYKTKSGAMRGARALLQKLQNKIDKNHNMFCENYGQKEIREFEDKLSNLHYIEQCNIMVELNKVSSMTPNRYKPQSKLAKEFVNKFK